MTRREFIKWIVGLTVFHLISLRLSVSKTTYVNGRLKSRLVPLPVEDLSNKPLSRISRRRLGMPIRSVLSLNLENPPWERAVVIASCKEHLL